MARGRATCASELPGPPLPAAVQTVLFFLRPVEAVEWLRRRYGARVRLRVFPFGRVAYLADEAAIKAVFTGSPGAFHAGEGNAALEPILGPHSVLLLDDEEHLAKRRLLLPPFHGDAVRRYADLVASITEQEVAGWEPGRPFPLRPAMQRITLETILRAVIGVSDKETLAKLRRAIPTMLSLRARETLLLWGAPGLVGSRWTRFMRQQRAARRVDALLYDEIRERRGNPAEHGDVLSMLVAARDGQGQGLSDEEMRDQLVTLLLAGHETTATGLAWAFERLMRHPDVEARLRADLDAGSDAYLDATVKETLRVRPVVMDVARKLTRPVEIDGHTIRAGTVVMPSILLAHLDPDEYPDPHAFRPERFLDARPGTYTWLPFGGGPRRCIGAAFATMEMQTVLRTVLSLVDLSAPGPAPERPRFRHVTLVPARGAEAIITPRPRPPRERPRTAAGETLQT